MNINILEQAARKAFKGETVESTSLLKRGIITPAEHRSLESLSSHIAANVRVMSGGANSGAVVLNSINKGWL